jgi:hypothetical protein
MILGSCTIGSVPLASNPQSALSPYIYEYLEIYIDGVDVTNTVKIDSLEINISISDARKCTLMLVDGGGTDHHYMDEVVIVRWNGTRIFGGIITNIVEQVSIGPDLPLFLSIEALDYSKILDRITIKETYEYKTAEYIVRDMIYSTEIITDHTYRSGSTIFELEGISVKPAERYAVNTIEFEHDTIVECLDALKEKTGMSWRITPHLAIELFYDFTEDAPFDVGDYSGYQKSYRNLKYTRNLDQYRNVQRVIAGKDLTTAYTETFVGDGETTEFTLAHELASPFNDYDLSPMAPIVKINGAVVTSGDKSKVTGEIRYSSPGVPIAGWTRFLYADRSDTINMNPTNDDTNNPILTSGDTLEITYQSYYDIDVCVRDEDAIKYLQAHTSGSGVYENTNTDTELNSEVLALEKANLLLSQYGQIPEKIEYETDQYGLLPGMQQAAHFAGVGTSGNFTITDISITFPRSDYIRCVVGASNLITLRRWAAWWRKTDIFRD